MVTSIFEILDGFSLVWVPMNQPNSAFLWILVIMVIDNFNQILLTIFDFDCLTNFAKGIILLCKAYLWCVLLRKRSIYTSKSNQYIPLGAYGEQKLNWNVDL